MRREICVCDCCGREYDPHEPNADGEFDCRIEVKFYKVNDDYETNQKIRRDLTDVLPSFFASNPFNSPFKTESQTFEACPVCMKNLRGFLRQEKEAGE